MTQTIAGVAGRRGTQTLVIVTGTAFQGSDDRRATRATRETQETRVRGVKRKQGYVVPTWSGTEATTRTHGHPDKKMAVVATKGAHTDTVNRIWGIAGDQTARMVAETTPTSTNLAINKIGTVKTTTATGGTDGRT